MRGQLHYEERIAVLYAMLNEDSLDVFGAMTAKEREFIHRLLAVALGGRNSVPRKHRRHIRPLRRAAP